MPRLKVQVTSKHIEQGKRFDSGYCPVALALRDKLDLGTPVTVYPSYCILGSSSHYWSCDRDVGQVALFINRFDRRMPVEPFEFEFEVADYIQLRKEVPSGREKEARTDTQSQGAG